MSTSRLTVVHCLQSGIRFEAIAPERCAGAPERCIDETAALNANPIVSAIAAVRIPEVIAFCQSPELLVVRDDAGRGHRLGAICEIRRLHVTVSMHPFPVPSRAVRSCTTYPPDPSGVTTMSGATVDGSLLAAVTSNDATPETRSSRADDRDLSQLAAQSRRRHPL